MHVIYTDFAKAMDVEESYGVEGCDATADDISTAAGYQKFEISNPKFEIILHLCCTNNRKHEY